MSLPGAVVSKPVASVHFVCFFACVYINASLLAAPLVQNSSTIRRRVFLSNVFHLEHDSGINITCSFIIVLVDLTVIYLSRTVHHPSHCCDVMRCPSAEYWYVFARIVLSAFTTLLRYYCVVC